MAQVTGRVNITINGQLYESNNGAKLDPGGTTRTSQTSDQSINHVEKLRPSKITAEFPWTKGLSLVALNDVSDATLQFIGDTGDVYVVNNGFRTGELVGTAGDNGNVPVEFEGDPATEVTGA